MDLEDDVGEIARLCLVGRRGRLPAGRRHGFAVDSGGTPDSSPKDWGRTALRPEARDKAACRPFPFLSGKTSLQSASGS
jgi:hypothetical protein